MDITLFLHFRDEIVLVGMIIAWICLEFLFRYLKKQFKKQVTTDNISVEAESKENEFYISYYRKSQIIDILRVIWLATFLFTVLMLKAPSAFNFVLVATGAIIITFKDVILSFASFFLVISQYRVGDTIAISWVQGEIIYIRPLYVWILGKDENGEHTWQLYYLPNNKFLSEPARKEELRLTAYKKEMVVVRYNSRHMTVDLQTFIYALSEFLNKRLIVRDLLHVGNFRSFAGYRYKLDFKSDKDGTLLEISFVWKPVKNAHIKRDIYIFADSFAHRWRLNREEDIHHD